MSQALFLIMNYGLRGEFAPGTKSTFCYLHISVLDHLATTAGYAILVTQASLTKIWQLLFSGNTGDKSLLPDDGLS